jgi:alpha-methylacyl-CoA racemase
MSKRGPLAGVKVVEVAGLGPGPFAAMVLADLGADVVRVARPSAKGPFEGASQDAVNRGRPTVTADLKSEEGRELVLRLCDEADALLEGFRPGVMERLGLGPDELLARRPQLVYGRITGYGQDGPMASVAGHDINYISVAGVLGPMARAGERPLMPLNLVGDYGGGGMLLALGVLAAIIEARVSGQGQVVDAAMVEGSALLSTAIHGLSAVGQWSAEAGTNVIDSGAHFYEVYETSDGGHVAVGAIEPQFYAELLRLIELEPGEAPQWDRSRWPELKERFAAVFSTRTRDEWAAVLEPAEACATAVLGLHEAPNHPQNVARGSFVEIDGITQPAPAPRFSRTPPERPRSAASWGDDASAWAALRDRTTKSEPGR